ncbi:nucleotidyltransferase family protein [Cyclobacteriaceae bacterium]|nr:nucleotidyltransferase family protein [Cyclobacteriaceae bacterium]MDB4316215.1 nucleotidyltransferase family protein [Cyclobacteriaceae bacterium]MDB4605748.1 nucleotidyltransferase family protein [Cyclobacteriaceae bacterium]|tara:strand:+ start:1232 stop:2278 length:1047 start_codon:yes stop_codon:yes gene_type:complete
MQDFQKHLISEDAKIKDTLVQLSALSPDLILFVVDKNNKLLGSITDGDIRRGLIKKLNLNDQIDGIIQRDTKFITIGNLDIQKIIDYKRDLIHIVPILNEKKEIQRIISFREYFSFLSIDVVIMAGGKGERLRPLTEHTPKPLLNVGDGSIIEHNINRFIKYGITNFWISINYLGGLIKNHLGEGPSTEIKINYLEEDKPLGTIGALSKSIKFKSGYVLLTNSDILTNLDYEDFLLKFLNSDADFAITTVSHNYTIPFGVVEIDQHVIKRISEKPTFNYQCNAGIYLMKKEVLDLIPKDTFFNTTDLIEVLLSMGKIIFPYQFSGYWLDIGSHHDFQKAQRDIKTVKF